MTIIRVVYDIEKKPNLAGVIFNNEERRSECGNSMECPRCRKDIETYSGKPDENGFVTLTLRCSCGYWKNRRVLAESLNESTRGYHKLEAPVRK